MNPDKHTNQELFLDVGDGHQIYVQDWGNPEIKIPIVYLHGGPGNGCDDRDKRKFDPSKQRVIFHDQRGAGKSLPTGSLKNNTSQDLVQDIGKLTDKLGLKKFILCGGSWGSTLSLLYGIAHPERVVGMVIDGIFTATQMEFDWLERGGWQTFYPEIWQEYCASVPQKYRTSPSEYYFKQAESNDPEAAKRAAYEYIKMEMALLKLDDIYQVGDYEKFEPGSGLIEIHYLSNRCFIDENYIVKNASKLKMPVWLVQGRYDMVCPPAAAYNLHKALPNSKLIWTISGHLKQYESKNIVNLLLDHLQEAG